MAADALIGLPEGNRPLNIIKEFSSGVLSVAANIWPAPPL
jgi:hypothetical protein